MVIEKLKGIFLRDLGENTMKVFLPALEVLVEENVKTPVTEDWSDNLVDILSPPRMQDRKIAYIENYKDFIETITVTIYEDGSIEAAFRRKGTLKEELVRVDEWTLKEDCKSSKHLLFYTYNSFLHQYKYSMKPYWEQSLAVILQLLDKVEKKLIRNFIRPPKEYTVVFKYDLITRKLEVCNPYKNK